MTIESTVEFWYENGSPDLYCIYGKIESSPTLEDEEAVAMELMKDTMPDEF